MNLSEMAHSIVRSNHAATRKLNESESDDEDEEEREENSKNHTNNFHPIFNELREMNLSRAHRV